MSDKRVRITPENVARFPVGTVATWIFRREPFVATKTDDDTWEGCSGMEYSDGEIGSTPPAFADREPAGGTPLELAREEACQLLGFEANLYDQIGPNYRAIVDRIAARLLR